MTHATLLPDAAAKLAQATVLLATIGLTPHEAGLLALASKMADATAYLTDDSTSDDWRSWPLAPKPQP